MSSGVIAQPGADEVIRLCYILGSLPKNKYILLKNKLLKSRIIASKFGT